MPKILAAPAARALCFLLVLVALSGCRRTEAEYQRLVEENKSLKGKIELLTRRTPDEKAGRTGADAAPNAPDLELTIVDLWSQRFDDNEFRAKQRLSNKLIRLTGAVGDVAADAIGLTGTSKRFGPIQVGINLTSGYAARIKDGLAALDRGTVVTVQGKFLYERMTLSESVFVDKATGQPLYADDLLALTAGAPRVAPRPK